MGSLYQPGMFLSSKKRKDKSVTFRLENKALRSLAAHFKNRTGGFRGHMQRHPCFSKENTPRALGSAASGRICAHHCTVDQDSAGMTGRGLCLWGTPCLPCPATPFTGICLGFPAMLGPKCGLIHRGHDQGAS